MASTFARDAVGATDGTVRFADGGAGEYDVVIWATGFRVDHSWIDLPGVKDDNGRVKHTRGVTPSPGLYLLGTDLAVEAHLSPSWLGRRGRRLPGRTNHNDKRVTCSR